jgi:minor fimbrial subunit
MRKLGLLTLLACLLVGGARADTALGEINIQLTGNIVDRTCIAAPGNVDKTVNMGTWATKQIRNTGDRSREIPFSLSLMGCPESGKVSITFSGTASASNSELLALNGSSTATHIALELRDSDRTRLPLDQASQEMTTNANGDATMVFYANYIAIANNPQPGIANADATFVINYE